MVLTELKSISYLCNRRRPTNDERMHIVAFLSIYTPCSNQLRIASLRSSSISVQKKEKKNEIFLIMLKSSLIEFLNYITLMQNLSPILFRTRRFEVSPFFRKSINSFHSVNLVFVCTSRLSYFKNRSKV